MSFRRPAGGAGPYAKGAAWLFTLIAPFLLYLVARTAVIALSNSAAVPAALLPPTDYRPLARQMARAALVPGAKVTPEHLDVARKAAVSSPLSYEPFLLMAKASEQDRDLASAITLLQEVRRRRPSHAVTRVLLANHYARNAQPMRALLELDAALRLEDKVRPLILPQLTKLLETRDGIEALATVLATEPIWREDFLRAASGQKLPPAQALALLKVVSARKKGRNIGPEIDFSIESLVFNGAFKSAREIWLQRLPAEERGRASLLFDGDFGGARATGPFAWQLHELDVGRSELVKDRDETYLDVRYHGGRGASLVEQTTVLQPGRYSLKVSAKTDTPNNPAGFSWRITCLPDGNSLSKLDLTPLNDGYSQFSSDFEVPAYKCAGQRITLLGDPGEVAATTGLQVAQVMVASR